jgi:hypothetical protein
MSDVRMSKQHFYKQTDCNTGCNTDCITSIARNQLSNQCYRERYMFNVKTWLIQR